MESDWAEPFFFFPQQSVNYSPLPEKTRMNKRRRKAVISLARSVASMSETRSGVELASSVLLLGNLENSAEISLRLMSRTAEN